MTNYNLDVSWIIESTTLQTFVYQRRALKQQLVNEFTSNTLKELTA